MVVKTLTEYMSDQLINRVSTLQEALYQAEAIMHSLEKENKRLKDALHILDSVHNHTDVCDADTNALCGV